MGIIIRFGFLTTLDFLVRQVQEPSQPYENDENPLEIH